MVGRIVHRGVTTSGEREGGGDTDDACTGWRNLSRIDKHSSRAELV